MIKSLIINRKLKILVNLSFSFLFIILILISSLFAPDSAQKNDYYSKITPQDIKSSEIVFDLGINITNIGDLDLSSKTFNAEGSVWLKWNELPDWVADEWDLEISEMPIKSLYFTNIADREGFQSEIDPSKPYLDTDGKFIQWLSFSGTFYAKDINLRRFPFEQIDLPIELESDDFNISDAVFIHNQEGSIVGSRRDIHGFKYKGVEVNTFKHFYNTNWGLKENDLYSAIPNTSEYPSLVTKVTYERNVAASILNIFLPIILIMILVILNPFIEIADSQIQLPASLLLVLTFARSGYKEMLPDSLSYTTYADMFFLMCLGVTLIIFLYAIFVANKYNRSSNKAVTMLKEVNIYVSKLSITFVVVVPFIIWSILPN